jgi:hypothetical protein
MFQFVIRGIQYVFDPMISQLSVIFVLCSVSLFTV